MIKLLGFRRTLTLAILLGINAILLAAYFLWAQPQATDLEGQIAGLRAQLSSLQTNIQNTKSDMKMLQENLPLFDELKRRGFMQEQDRFVLSRAMEDIKTKAAIRGFSFSVGDIDVIDNQDAMAANKRLLHSRVSISNISSLLDVNFFDLMALIESDYPVQARINSFDISRSTELKSSDLEKLKSGPVSMVTANLTFDWFSLGSIPDVMNRGGR